MAAPAAFRPSDFFSRQDKARRNTRLLVLWFAAGVLGTVLGVYGACLVATGLLPVRGDAGGAGGLWRPGLFLVCSASTLLVIGGASLIKTLSLSAGGGAVALSAGGRRVEPDTSDEDERRLLNVVEEMALASGAPMPEVYILDREEGINAFAAGDSIENAAVAVTRGALHKLTRDELQAVMGHEFSHILNGDMRLNLRLIGWIAGLVALTVLARLIMEAGNAGSWSASRREDRKGGAAILLFGVLVLVIGLVGQLFAQIIQAAISRSREHLADASATQFTRNPEALANALRRIGGSAAGSRLNDAHASEIAHMCFGEGVASMFATHPPLAERIRLLKPDWDGTYLPVASGAETRFAPERTPEEIDREFRRRFMAPRAAADEPADAPADAPRLAPDLLALTRSPLGARTLAILLLMTDNAEANRIQAEMIKGAASRELFDSLKTSWNAARGVRPRDRLATLRLAAPALRRLPGGEADTLLTLLRDLAACDGAVSFFEIALIRTVAAITHPSDDTARETRPDRLAPALRLTLGALLLAGASEDDPGAALEHASRLAPGYGPLGRPPSPEEITSDALENAFATLAEASFELRAQALAAAKYIAELDSDVNDSEADLLAALAAALRCHGAAG